jgi:transcriptional regulator with XRE-family HTH domain
MASGSQIGDYLRARRELVGIEEVGLAEVGHRRVPGLRREEVAMLAGISPDYYMRLEQGRDLHPSMGVIDALGRALLLEGDEIVHLRALAGLGSPGERPARTQEVPRRTVELLDSLVETPAYVFDRHLDILAANALARETAPFFCEGTNLLRSSFLHPEIVDKYGERTRAMQASAATLRALVGPDVRDARLEELVGELSVCSEEFRQLWARHDVVPDDVGPWRFDHPEVGYIELSFEWLSISGADRLTLLIYHADPGSVTEQRMARLRDALIDRRSPNPCVPRLPG